MKLISAGDHFPRDSRKIFIHAVSGDETLREAVTAAICEMNRGEYVSCYADQPEEICPDCYPVELSQMSLAIVIVSERYLDYAQRTGFRLADFSKETGLAVIPVLKNADLVPSFSKLMGSLHAIIFDKKGWGSDLEKQINRKFIGSELLKEIACGAFDGKMFLSYRKKDIGDALKIMKAVHDTSAASGYEIWFDDFLRPGENFHDEIRDAMQSSDIFLLSVTPSLVEPASDGGKNYVQAQEYPAAKAYGMPIVPVEARKTDRQIMELEGFTDVPAFVPLKDNQELDNRIKAVGKEAEKQDTRSARKVYLLGMAFFLGVHVEKDVHRAIELLTIAAKMGSREGAEELSGIYALGLGTGVNQDKAILYLQRSFEIAESLPVDDADRARQMYRAIHGTWEGKYRIGKDQSEEAAYCSRLLKVLENCFMYASEDENDEFCLMYADTLMDMGNLENGPIDRARTDEENVRSAIARLKEAKEYLDCCEDKRSARFLSSTAAYYSLYSSALRTVDLFNKATDFAWQALYHQQELVRDYDDTYEARLQLASYRMNLGGCIFNNLYPHLKEHLVDADNYFQPARCQLIEAASSYEELYSEKRQLTCGLEAASCYCNLTLVNTDMKQNRKYLQRGFELLERIEKDYPNVPAVEEYRKKLERR